MWSILKDTFTLAEGRSHKDVTNMLVWDIMAFLLPSSVSIFPLSARPEHVLPAVSIFTLKAVIR